jgi:hypothetical protein
MFLRNGQVFLLNPVGLLVVMGLELSQCLLGRLLLVKASDEDSHPIVILPPELPTPPTLLYHWGFAASSKG